MKIDKKRLLWAIKEELCIVLFVIVMLVFLAIPWICFAFVESYWWFLLYPATFFVVGVWEKYNGR